VPRAARPPLCGDRRMPPLHWGWGGSRCRKCMSWSTWELIRETYYSYEGATIWVYNIGAANRWLLLSMVPHLHARLPSRTPQWRWHNVWASKRMYSGLHCLCFRDSPRIMLQCSSSYTMFRRVIGWTSGCNAYVSETCEVQRCNVIEVVPTRIHLGIIETLGANSCTCEAIETNLQDYWIIITSGPAVIAQVSFNSTVQSLML